MTTCFVLPRFFPQGVHSHCLKSSMTLDLVWGPATQQPSKDSPQGRPKGAKVFCTAGSQWISSWRLNRVVHFQQEAMNKLSAKSSPYRWDMRHASNVMVMPLCCQGQTCTKMSQHQMFHAAPFPKEHHQLTLWQAFKVKHKRIMHS